MKSTTIAKIAAALLLSQLATGCAVTNAVTTEDSALTKTSDYFGAKPSEIAITNYEKQLLTTTFKARYKGALYNCVIYYGQLNCKKPGA